MKIKEWMLKNLRKDSVIIEAGTCEGSDTDFFGNSFPYGMIHGFEPIPELFEITKNKNSNKRNVKLYQMALSDTTGEFEINVSSRFGESWGSSSILAPKDHLSFHPDISFTKKIKIQGIKLDDWAAQNGVFSVDFMWLDMQGYEPLVLKSSINVLSNTKYIYSEVSLIELYEGIILYPEFKDFMKSQGFDVVYEDLPWEDAGNVLFENIKYKI